MESKGVALYTDGSCLGNPGAGGWAFIDTRTGYSKSGAGRHETNNTMELTAMAEAIEYAGSKYPHEHVTVYTDSCYVKNGINTWISLWKRNGWMTSSRKPVKNRDLWKRLVAARDPLGSRITFRWVKGHSTNPHNDRVDKLARQAALEVLHGRRPRAQPMLAQAQQAPRAPSTRVEFDAPGGGGARTKFMRTLHPAFQKLFQV